MSLSSDLDRYEPAGAELDESALDFANKLLREIRANQRDRAEFERVAREERERIEAWLTDHCAGIEERNRELEERLAGFARAWKDRTGHAPPAVLNGVLRLTPPRFRIEVTDPEAFRDWAEGNQRLDLLRIKVEPDKTAIQKIVTEGPAVFEESPDEERRPAVIEGEGEAIPGLELRRSKQESFTYKTAS